MLLTAVSDAERLAPWAYTNASVMDADERLEEVVREALGQPRAHVPNGTPALVFAKGKEPAMPLIEALVTGKRGYLRKGCDACKTPIHPEHRLWVGAGATVVEVHVCFHCRPVLNFAHRDCEPLVWG